ncbi:MAG: magnesium transporter [Limnochordia bacterium]|jgi:magnesium transporter|nr:magnesium transporter [Bacillota bacterium]
MSVREGLNQVRQALKSRSWVAITQIIKEMHPTDQAELIKELTPTERQQVFSHLSYEQLAEIVAELHYEEQQDLLKELGRDKIPGVLDEMSSDDVVDLLRELEMEQAQELLDLMGTEEAQDVRDLLVYPEQTAGALMTTEYVALPHQLSAGKAIEALRIISPDAEMIYYVYVIDEAERLVGVVSLRDLIVAKPITPLHQIMRKKVISVPAGMDQEEVALLLDKYDFLALPVVDVGNHLLGIITVDDVMDVITEEATEDIIKMAGIHGMDDFTLSPKEAAMHRLPWLVFLLIAGFFTGSIITHFEDTLQSVMTLAAFIPVIADMAGNTGTQALAVAVRSMALHKFVGKDVLELLRQEARIGLIIGTVCGLLVALFAFLWHGNPFLGFVVGVSMWVTLLVSTIIGALMPVLFNALGVDPAVASGPFITTVNDIVGLGIYFSLATRFLSYLV